LQKKKKNKKQKTKHFELTEFNTYKAFTSNNSLLANSMSLVRTTNDVLKVEYIIKQKGQTKHCFPMGV